MKKGCARILINKPNVIDLFCGCGGFSKGFEAAGFEILLGIDSWKDATVTYNHNFPEAVVLNQDITTVSGKILVEYINKNNSNNIDVIIGGPPCQGFSLSGKRMQDDPRNKLYKSFVEIVGELRPKIFVMENVPGIVRLFGGKIKNEIIEDFSSLGYRVEMQLLSADSYGVPQQRKRVFFVGINSNNFDNTEKFNFPTPTHGADSGLLPVITCQDAISDLDFIPDDIALPECIEYQTPTQSTYQKMMRLGSTTIYNHSITLHKQRTKEIIEMVPNGGNYKDLPKTLWQTRKVNIAWTRMNSQKPCFTIDTGHNHHFHYRANRVPTVRESARIQSFPDTFTFIGIKTSQLRQVGNAVPPLLAESIAREIKHILDKG